LTNETIKVRRRNLVVRKMSLNVSDPEVVRENDHDVGKIFDRDRDVQAGSCD
jgi:hypothetical protein